MAVPSLAEIELTPAQLRAEEQIEASIVMRRQHLLTGGAGTGKTTLVQRLAMKHANIVLTAPTHKAVAVLSRKLLLAGINVHCCTIHSLLSLRPKPQGDKQIFVRADHAKPVLFDIVFIDEASMLDSSMMEHIDRHLAARAVILIGDPGQLPPVGEARSRSFDVMPASHLDTIVRQAEGNPIIAAAAVIRASQQKEEIDWSWTHETREGNTGIFAPNRNDVDTWMRRAFCSEQFAADPDFARYLCYTNARVAEINTRIRRWLHGDAAVRPGAPPFLPGELALIRSPLIIEDTVAIAVNAEVTVIDIEAGQHLGVSVWRTKVQTEAGLTHDIHVPRDMNEFQVALNNFKDDCRNSMATWGEYHEFVQQFIRAQSIYALTIHNAQGSTFRFAFLDVPDIRRRIRDNPLEAKQLLYTGATRPSDGLVLVGV